jgi:hypothetical protein
MTFAALLLFACTPDEPANFSSRQLIELDPNGPEAYPAPWGLDWGKQVGAGIDLDHDGVQEWAATAPSTDFNVQYTNVLEDGEMVATREASSILQYGFSLAAGGDTNGDGHGDVAISHWDGFSGVWMELARSMDASEDVKVFLPDDVTFRVGPSTFLQVDGREHLLMTSYASTTRWRVDLFDLEGIEPGTDVVGGDHTLVFADDPLDSAVVGSVVPVDVDGDGTDEWVGGRSKAYVDGEGYSWVCPARTGLQIPDDCDELGGGALGGRAGGRHAVGDLDGDGQPEIVATYLSSDWEDVAHGEVHVVGLDGEVLAHIQGTRERQLGGSPLVFTGDDGTPWLVVAELNSYSSGTLVYGFRGDQLIGEGDEPTQLLDTDAARVWTTGGVSLGFSMTTYRATPDAPLQLVMGEPKRGSGVVYVVDAPR